MRRAPARVLGSAPIIPRQKKNCLQADHQSSARETIIRSSVRSTPACARTRRHRRGVNSTRISHGQPGSYGATAPSRPARGVHRPRSARAPARRSMRALKRPSPASPRPSSARRRAARAPSRHEAASPVTSSTGQPHVPQSAALIPVSPTSMSLNQRFCQARPETVWLSTPSRDPGARVHPDEERGVAALLEEARVLRPVLLDDELAAGSSRSGRSELNVQPLPAPWQSMTTISVAPAGLAPRTAALISSV